MSLLAHGVEHGSEGSTDPEPAHVSDVNAPLACDDKPQRERIAVPVGEKAFGVFFPSHLVDSRFHDGDEVLGRQKGGCGCACIKGVKRTVISIRRRATDFEGMVSGTSLVTSSAPPEPQPFLRARPTQPGCVKGFREFLEFQAIALGVMGV